jgi:AraC-like DNA-binding protein
MTISSEPKDKTKIWKLKTGFGNIEMMTAEYYTQSFAKHSHDDFPLGVIEKGAMSFYFRRNNLIAPKGTINLSYPGEIHNGQSFDHEGWHYRMFYFDLIILKKIFLEFQNRKSDLPFFMNGVIEDSYLATFLSWLHKELELKNLSALETDAFIVQTISYLIFKHSDQHCEFKKKNINHNSIQKVIDYIQAYYTQNISLPELSTVAGISPYHFLRVFSNYMGITPHGYLMQTRVKKARQLMSTQKSLVNIALDTGFSDQSHLTRRFKQILGVTPQQYRNIIQD